MFCRNCGKQLPDGAGFCPACGTATGQQQAPQQQVPYQQQTQQPPVQQAPYQQPAPGGAVQPAAKKKPVVPIVIGVIVVLAIVGVVAGINLLSKTDKVEGTGATTAQAAADELGDVMAELFVVEDDDDLLEFSNALLDLLPDAFVEAVKDEMDYTDDELAEYFTEMLGYYDVDDVLEMLEDLGGLQITFDIEPGDALDEDDLEDIEDEFDDYGVDVSVTAGYVVEGTVIYTATSDDNIAYLEEGESFEYDAASVFSSIVIIEIDDLWYIWMS